jgi:hypothetical protein
MNLTATRQDKRRDYRKKLITFLRDCHYLANKPRQRKDILLIVEAFFEQESFTAYDVQALIGRGTSYSYARKLIGHLLRLKCLTQLPGRQSHKTHYTFHSPSIINHILPAHQANGKAALLTPQENINKITKTKEEKLRSNFSSHQSDLKTETQPSTPSKPPAKRKRECGDVYEHCKQKPSLLKEPLKVDERYPFWRDIMRHVREWHNERGDEFTKTYCSLLTWYYKRVKPTIHQALDIVRVVNNYIKQGVVKTLRQLIWRITYAVNYVMRKRVMKQEWYYLPPEQREPKQKQQPKATYSTPKSTYSRDMRDIVADVVTALKGDKQEQPKEPPKYVVVDSSQVSIAELYKQQFGAMKLPTVTAEVTEDGRKSYRSHASRNFKRNWDEVFGRDWTEEDIERTRQKLLASKQGQQIDSDNTATPLKEFCDALVKILEQRLTNEE